MTARPPEFVTRPFLLDSKLQQGLVFRNLKWGRLTLIVAVIALLIPGLEIALGRPDRALARLPFSVIGVLIYFAFILLLIGYRNYANARKKSNRYVFEDDRIVVSTHEGLRQTLTSGIESFVPWNLIQRISLKPNWVELWFTAGMFFVIPNDAMPSLALREELQEFARVEGIEKAL